MHLFYCPSAPTNNILDETESQHAVKVLRLNEGDAIEVTNGKGELYTATISKAHFKKCEFSIIDTKVSNQKKDFYIHLAIAPTKSNDRIEWCIEKCVELGIDEITLLNCQHSERRNANTERAVKVAISAMKQSYKATLPKINEVVAFNTFVKQAQANEKFIAYLDEANKQHLHQLASPHKQYIILIGPEGDFSKEEITLAKSQAFTPVSLGESRLRTETAGIAACHILNLKNMG